LNVHEIGVSSCRHNRRTNQAPNRSAFRTTAKDVQPLGHWIRVAWESEDVWLRACAVRASRHDPSIDLRTLPLEDDAPEIVRRELSARYETQARRSAPGSPRWEPSPC